MAHYLLHCFAIALTLGVGLYDYRTGVIPNWLTLPGLGLAILCQLGLWGWHGLASSLAGVVVCILIPWVLYRTSQGHGIGGGDLKLFGVIGAALGPTLGLEVELSAFMLLTLFALLRLAFLGRLLHVLGNVLFLIINPLLPKTRRRSITPESLTTMRMGPAIAIATVTVTTIDLLTRTVQWLV